MALRCYYNTVNQNVKECQVRVDSLDFKLVPNRSAHVCVSTCVCVGDDRGGDAAMRKMHQTRGGKAGFRLRPATPRASFSPL